MLQNKKMVIPGLVLAIALGGFSLVNAATKTTAGITKSPATAVSATSTANSTQSAPVKEVKPVVQPKAKLSEDQATKIALAAHKGAKLTEIKLVIENSKPFYIAKLDTVKGTRELKIGGNSGKIFRDQLRAAVKTTK